MAKMVFTSLQFVIQWPLIIQRICKPPKMRRGWELIKANHADLLLFGEVRERDKAVKIWAVNEHGGCDLDPKPTIIERGDIPGDFTAEEKEKLIEVSLEQIQSACLNQSSIDWPLFAKRMNKMEMFLNNFDFSQPKYLYFASSYIDATRLCTKMVKARSGSQTEKSLQRV